MTLVRSASAISLLQAGPILSEDASIDMILLSLLPQMAAKMAPQPSSPSSLPLSSTDVNAPLTPIKEAITTAEATPRLLRERSSVSTGSVPLIFLTGRAYPSKFTYAQGDIQMSVQVGAHLGCKLSVPSSALL